MFPCLSLVCSQPSRQTPNINQHNLCDNQFKSTLSIDDWHFQNNRLAFLHVSFPEHPTSATGLCMNLTILYIKINSYHQHFHPNHPCSIGYFSLVTCNISKLQTKTRICFISSEMDIIFTSFTICVDQSKFHILSEIVVTTNSI